MAGPSPSHYILIAAREKKRKEKNNTLLQDKDTL
jgi:hypothetical protein